MRSHMFPKPSESVRVRLSGNVALRARLSPFGARQETESRSHSFSGHRGVLAHGRPRNRVVIPIEFAAPGLGCAFS
jgi:hypothetical protein